MNRALPLLLLLAGCPHVGADSSKPAPAEPATPPAIADAGSGMPSAHIDVEARGGKSFGLEVELALTDADRERGLMFRKALADDRGMLFVFVDPSQHNFWMKNTLIPLDMIFADASANVMGCVARAEPMTLSSRKIDGDSKYVLEVPGGWCADHGIDKGARIIVGEAGKLEPQ